MQKQFPQQNNMGQMQHGIQHTAAAAAAARTVALVGVAEEGLAGMESVHRLKTTETCGSPVTHSVWQCKT
jgi:hypothetical protein